MKKNIVVYEDKARVSSLLVADGFQRRHEQITRLLKKYQNKFEELDTLKVLKKIQGRGNPVQEYWLTESQFLFLGTLFKNSDTVVAFKLKLVKAFEKTRRQLAAAKSQQSDQKWIMSRDFGKDQRLALTDAIKEFVEYAKAQGSENADRYYTIISRMTNGLLFIFDGKYKSAREMLTAQQLMTLASAEQIITKGLQDSMRGKMFYKDIYSKIKDHVMQFAALTGQTHVIEEQLKLEGKNVSNRLED